MTKEPAELDCDWSERYPCATHDMAITMAIRAPLIDRGEQLRRSPCMTPGYIVAHVFDLFRVDGLGLARVRTLIDWAERHGVDVRRARKDHATWELDSVRCWLCDRLVTSRHALCIDCGAEPLHHPTVEQQHEQVVARIAKLQQKLVELDEAEPGPSLATKARCVAAQATAR